MPRMRKLVFCNRKGGVGKTASAINVAAGLGRHGQRTLLIDLDSQTNATHVLSRTPSQETITDVVLGSTPPNEAIVATTEKNVFLLPGAEDFANFAVRAREVNEALPQLVLQQRLASIEGFDFVVVDTPASLDLTVVNALAYADEAWVPVEASSFAVQAIHRLDDMIRTLRDHFQDTTIVLAGVFTTLVNPRTISFQNVIAHLRQNFPDQASQVAIHRAEDIKYALSNHQSIYAYAPRSMVAQQYSLLTNEIIAYEPKAQVQTRVG